MKASMYEVSGSRALVYEVKCKQHNFMHSSLDESSMYIVNDVLKKWGGGVALFKIQKNESCVIRNFEYHIF